MSWDGDQLFCCVSCNCATLSGTNPANVYCSYLCHCFCGCLGSYQCDFHNGHYFFTNVCYCISTGSCVISQCCHATNDGYYPANAIPYSGSGCVNLDVACNYIFIGICNSAYQRNYGTYGSGVYLTSITTFLGMYMVQCYCVVPDNCTCEYERLWSLKDYSETQTILDPNGTLNYLAIGYS